VSLLSLALITLFVLSAAVSTLFGSPSELAARWVFAAGEPAARGLALEGVRRALWVVAVGPSALVAGATAASLGDAWLALCHVGWCVALGALMIELWMREVQTVPFTVARDPGTSRLHRLWPLYVAGLLTIGYTSAGIEQRLLARPGRLALTMSVILAMAAGLRIVHRRRAPRMPFVGVESEPALQTLGLSGALPAPASTSEAR
jgi:hypothetical protein